MVAKKPRIVVIGAGIAGLAAAHKLHHADSNHLFELTIVEASDRIGGRIYSSEFGGDRIEIGATWIHGIGGSPVYNIAQQANALHSDLSWERMDGFADNPITLKEDGATPDPSLLSTVSVLYRRLMEFARERESFGDVTGDHHSRIAELAAKRCQSNSLSKNGISVGSFLRNGLCLYWSSAAKPQRDWQNMDDLFAMYENTERTLTAADDLMELDFEAESEYKDFPDGEITIAKGYSSIVYSLASGLPSGCIQFMKKVEKVVWMKDASEQEKDSMYPVSLYFTDGSVLLADHVIITVSLGVLKAETVDDGSGMFSPPLPVYKRESISRLGFGVVNKLFLQVESSGVGKDGVAYPFLQMAFDQRRMSTDKHNHDDGIPWWIKKTYSICPIYKKSSVLLAWFAGKEAMELESLGDDEIIGGLSKTLSFLGPKSYQNCCNANERQISKLCNAKIVKLLKSSWGTDPLFRGSYSYVAVGSSGEDMDLLAEPLPNMSSYDYSTSNSSLQLLFAGEATHRTHYSTTHGAYLSGTREACRLLKRYDWAALP